MDDGACLVVGLEAGPGEPIGQWRSARRSLDVRPFNRRPAELPPAGGTHESARAAFADGARVAVLGAALRGEVVGVDGEGLVGVRIEQDGRDPTVRWYPAGELVAEGHPVPAPADDGPAWLRCGAIVRTPRAEREEVMVANPRGVVTAEVDGPAHLAGLEAVWAMTEIELVEPACLTPTPPPPVAGFGEEAASSSPDVTAADAMLAAHDALAGVLEALDIAIRAGAPVRAIAARRRVAQALDALTDASTPADDGEGEGSGLAGGPELEREFRERAEAAEAELERVRAELDETRKREKEAVSDALRAMDERDGERRRRAAAAKADAAIADEVMAWRHAAAGLPALLLDVAGGRDEARAVARRELEGGAAGPAPAVWRTVERCADVAASLGAALRIVAGGR